MPQALLPPRHQLRDMGGNGRKIYVGMPCMQHHDVNTLICCHKAHLSSRLAASLRGHVPP